LSGLILRGGNCEHCAAPRRTRPVLVELLMGTALALLWGWAGGELGKFLAAAVILTLFLLIAIIDIEHRLILWIVIYPSAVIVALLGMLSPERGVAKTLLGGAVGYGLIGGLYLLGKVFSRAAALWRGQPLEEVAFGRGDVNLAGVVGLAVGWSGILFALLVAIFSAGMFALGYLIVQRARGRYAAFTPIPYGPFLVLGGLILYFYGREIAAAYLGR
jgi:leader peptidase (prepilin peptidase)/N-methyltransferase